MQRNLPAGFEAELLGYGWESAGALIDALRTTGPSLALRVNPAKGASPAQDASLVPWEPLGLYLDVRPVFAADPAWHQGRYYVQDASSMVLGEALRRIVATCFDDAAGLRYLDACAAPGGKTIAAIDSLPAGSFVVANEADRHRANILAENIARHGAPAVAVTRGDAARFSKLPETFDIIAADVPCSGEGMMRKDAEAIAQWSPALVAACASLQREITAALWTALRPGGVMIYSTCTFNRRENEENVDYLIREFGAVSIDLGLDCFPGVLRGIDTDAFCYRFTPGFVRGEGLFIAALRKPGDSARALVPPRTAKRKKGEADAFAERYLADASSWAVIERERVEAIPSAHFDLASRMADKFDAIRCGLPLAQRKGHDLVPVHELVLSTALRPGAIPAFPLDLSAALDYLRGETVADVPADLPRGFATPLYGGVPLGLVKNIGRRANNLYPDFLRLRLDPRSLTPVSLPISFT